ncbi:hypothetical protein CEUSTIGMA_g13194.t1 [Chlamydomonas eustigma]|uniref:Uncharacterized protein n=1 Tax=Chlamydomonas eustigma TaxID=1157962 RepID=A0A250XS60_9CHLO|nr:hypothetical protein CEUSTIGMA_g13194.t1 [Chlamydomonas eustigma]|eukprot:GAX85779.1 hypothetical protein CEUSTIGMA_g13194.t1 [Chlamydomonas eustigma]
MDILRGIISRFKNGETPRNDCTGYLLIPTSISSSSNSKCTFLAEKKRALNALTVCLPTPYNPLGTAEAVDRIELNFGTSSITLADPLHVGKIHRNIDDVVGENKLVYVSYAHQATIEGNSTVRITLEKAEKANKGQYNAYGSHKITCWVTAEESSIPCHVQCGPVSRPMPCAPLCPTERVELYSGDWIRMGPVEGRIFFPAVQAQEVTRLLSGGMLVQPVSNHLDNWCSLEAALPSAGMAHVSSVPSKKALSDCTAQRPDHSAVVNMLAQGCDSLFRGISDLGPSMPYRAQDAGEPKKDAQAVYKAVCNTNENTALSGQGHEALNMSHALQMYHPQCGSSHPLDGSEELRGSLESLTGSDLYWRNRGEERQSWEQRASWEPDEVTSPLPIFAAALDDPAAEAQRLQDKRCSDTYNSGLYQRSDSSYLPTPNILPAATSQDLGSYCSSSGRSGKLLPSPSSRSSSDSRSTCSTSSSSCHQDRSSSVFTWVSGRRQAMSLDPLQAKVREQVSGGSTSYFTTIDNKPSPHSIRGDGSPTCSSITTSGASSRLTSFEYSASSTRSSTSGYQRDHSSAAFMLGASHAEADWMGETVTSTACKDRQARGREAAAAAAALLNFKMVQGERRRRLDAVVENSTVAGGLEEGESEGQ